VTFDNEDKPSASRVVDVFRRTYDTSDETYLAAADACWDVAMSSGRPTRLHGRIVVTRRL
jgi:hypothetical protein